MRLLIFDIDGTVTEKTALEDEVFLGALRREFDFRTVDTDWSTYENVTDSGIVHEVFRRCLGRPPTRSEVRRLCNRYEAGLRAALGEHEDEAQAIPGAAAFIDDVMEDPAFKVAYATGNWRSIARFKLDRAGIRNRDVPLACADDGLAREALLRTAMERASSSGGIEVFTAVIALGDASWDARAAESVGIRFVGVGERWRDDHHRACAGRLVDYTDRLAVKTMLATIR